MSQEISLNQSISDEALSLVNNLFILFKTHISAFHAYASNPDDLAEIKKEWVLCFHNAKIGKQDVIRGANKIRNTGGMKYMMSPADFIDLCNPEPEDIGAPNLKSAFMEACEHSNPATWSSTWSHPAVKEAYVRTGHSQFLNGKQDKTLNIFTSHYRNACNDYAAGRIAPQIEHKKPFSSGDIDRPSMHGKYEMIRPGVMKIYENVSSAEESFAICDKLLGKGTSRLHQLVQNIEKNYKALGLI